MPVRQEYPRSAVLDLSGPPRPTVGPDLRVARVTIDLVGSDAGLTVRRGSKGRPNKKRGCARWRTPLLGRTRATRLAGVRGTNEQPRWLALEQSQRQRALPAASRTLVGLEASQPFQIIQFQHRSHGFRSSGIAPSVSASRGDPNTRSLTFASVQSIEARAIAVGSDLGLTPGPRPVGQAFHRPKGARRFWRDFLVFGSTTDGQPHDDADDFGRRWRREKRSMPRKADEGG